jgi:glycerophosphoryl diester phosphodiesterase
VEFISMSRLSTPRILVVCFTAVIAFAAAAVSQPVNGSSAGAEVQTFKRKYFDTTIGIINGRRPMVIAHRGSPGQLPDHTLEGYRKAIQEGADCIECDVVVTKDLKLVCRHEPWLDISTDSAQKYPEYTKTYNLPEAGGNITGVFSIDLTLDQINNLRAINPFPWRDRSYNGKFKIPTFQEYVRVATDKRNPKVVCIYPETKHPTFFNNHPVLKAAGTTIDDLLIQELRKTGYNVQAPYGSRAWLRRPVFIQSFEQNNLRYWKSKTAVPLVQLVDSAPSVDTGNTAQYLLSEPGVQEISRYAWGYAPWKGLYVVTNSSTNSIVKIDPTPVRLAHKYGMPVTMWTLRNEPRYLASQYKGNAANEYNLLMSVLGVSGGFTDHTYSFVDYAINKYKPSPADAADKAAAGDSSVYAIFGPPTWELAPVCTIPPTADNPLRYEGGKPFLTEKGYPCAYKHTVIP